MWNPRWTRPAARLPPGLNPRCCAAGLQGRQRPPRHVSTPRLIGNPRGDDFVRTSPGGTGHILRVLRLRPGTRGPGVLGTAQQPRPLRHHPALACSAADSCREQGRRLSRAQTHTAPTAARRAGAGPHAAVVRARLVGSLAQAQTAKLTFSREGGGGPGCVRDACAQAQTAGVGATWAQVRAAGAWP